MELSNNFVKSFIQKKQTEKKKTEYKKPGFGTCAGAYIAGATTSGLVVAPGNFVNSKIVKKMQGINEVSKDQFEHVNKAAKQILEKTGLSKKGVSIIRCTPENLDEISKICEKEMDKANRFTPKFIKKMGANNMLVSLDQGINAFYTFASKKILMPKEKMAMAVFHEIGHAANQNMSILGKILQNCRPLAKLIAPIALISLIKTPKAPGEKHKGLFDKVTSFIKEHAAGLTFLSFAPLLIEEAMASIKSIKFAKNIIDSSLLKQLKKSNALGFATYTIIALGASLGIKAGIKVRDSIAKPEPIEQKN